MRLKLYGYSDDIIGTEITRPISSRVTLPSSYQSAEPGVTTLRVASIGGARAMYVHAVYDGCWSFAPALVSEDCDNVPPFPPWSFTFAREHVYSLALTIDTGDDLVTVERVGKD